MMITPLNDDDFSTIFYANYYDFSAKWWWILHYEIIHYLMMISPLFYDELSTICK